MHLGSRPRPRPSLEVVGEARLEDGLISTLSLDFDLKWSGENGSAAHAVLLVASGTTYHEALAQLRSRTGAPTVLLLCEADLTDRVRALEEGADDVIVVPYDSSEVLARLRAVMRRADRLGAEVFSVDDLEINVERQVVRRGRRTVFLSRTELALLTTLARHNGAVVDHGMLNREVWGAPKSKTTIHTYISYLRAKLDGPGERPLVQTVRGVGYALRT
jgi:two-component system, OmpR family, response regulator